MNHDFYDERKWCPTCQSYVRYIMSVNHSYCVECNSQVRLFSKAEAEQFNEKCQKRKWRAS